MTSRLRRTPQHLWQPTRYRTQDGYWSDSFIDAARHAGTSLTWDVGALVSIIALGYPLGDRTLFREISRQPWLSDVSGEGHCTLGALPPHDYYWLQPERAAHILHRRLLDEARGVARLNRPITILMSGGLDSRIVAGIFAQLASSGDLRSPLAAVTWGLPSCRDVAYGREVSRTLRIDWTRLNIGPEDLWENVTQHHDKTAALVSPIHLHRMSWADSAHPEAIFLAGSYGDSIGRAEYSGLHLLDLRTISPFNSHGLLRRELVSQAIESAQQDNHALRSRSPGSPPHVFHEHQQQGHYMRNMISQSMMAVQEFRPLYQMFTDPSVYSFMWALHPACRTNDIYAHLLEKLHPVLAELPWARTNKSLTGVSTHAEDLPKQFHRYPEWIATDLYSDLRQLVDPEWFRATGVFDATAVRRLADSVGRDPSASGRHRNEIHARYLWLASVRILAEELSDLGIALHAPSIAPGSESRAASLSSGFRRLRRDFRRAVMNTAAMQPLQARLLALRRGALRKRALRDFPPKRWPRG